MRIMQMQRIIEFGIWHNKHRRWRHPVCQHPEKQVVIATEWQSRKRVSSRNSSDQGDNHIHENIQQRIQKAASPDL